MKDTLRQTANFVTVLVALTVNTLASILPLNGQTTGEISDRLAAYFVPAGYVFVIWFFIFVGWLVFAVYQSLPAQKENPRLQRLGYWFAVSNLVNAAWLFAWHYNLFGLSVLIMLALLGLLIVSYLRLDVNRASARGGAWWSVDLPFSLYLGWITVATVANVTSWLYAISWTGWGIPAPVWAAVMIAVASVVGLAMALTRRDAVYLFVLAWSFAGIAVKQAETAAVANSAWIAAVFVLGLAVFSLWRRRSA
jgi:hypothetical protein